MGLELDLSIVRASAKTSLAISLTGIIFPFILSMGASRFFYEYIPGVAELGSYPRFLLFIGVAMSVTALPVLARILTERGLLNTPVGISVITAATVDDAASWMALALVVSIAAATTPLTGNFFSLFLV